MRETFEWLRERSTRLDEVLAENERLAADNVRLILELARLRVKPIVDAEREGENVGDLMNTRLSIASTADTATPEPDAELLCLICAYCNPWGIFDNRTGASVCRDCRDAARSDTRVAEAWDAVFALVKEWPADDPHYRVNVITALEAAKSQAIGKQEGE